MVKITIDGEQEGIKNWSLIGKHIYKKVPVELAKKIKDLLEEWNIQVED